MNTPSNNIIIIEIYNNILIMYIRSSAHACEFGTPKMVCLIETDLLYLAMLSIPPPPPIPQPPSRVTATQTVLNTESVTQRSVTVSVTKASLATDTRARVSDIPRVDLCHALFLW